MLMLDPSLIPKPSVNFAVVAVRNKEEARASVSSWEALKLTESLRSAGKNSAFPSLI
jgi:hypothetical protein